MPRAVRRERGNCRDLCRRTAISFVDDVGQPRELVVDLHRHTPATQLVPRFPSIEVSDSTIGDEQTLEFATPIRRQCAGALRDVRL